MALCELAFRVLITGMHSFPHNKIAAVCQSTPKFIVNVDKDQEYYVKYYLDYMSFEMVWQFFCGISAGQKTLLDSEIVVTFQERVNEFNWLHEGENIFKQGASGGLGIEEVPSDADNLVPNLFDEERVAEGKPPLPSSLSLFPPSTTLDAPSTSLSISAASPTGDVVGSTWPQNLSFLSGISRTVTGVTAELAFVVPVEKVDSRRLLVILKCIYESQEPTLCQRIAKSCQNQLNFHLSLSAVDTNAIGYLIGRGSQKWEVSFTGCGLGEKEIKTLKHQITLPGKAGKIQALTICENPLDITSVVQLQEMRQALKNLRVLSLRSTELNDDSMELLSTIPQSIPSLKTLNLADNNISDEGMRILCIGLMKCAHLGEVTLSYNTLSELSMKHLASVITAGCQLSVLVLRGNSIGDEGVETLLSCMDEGYPLKHLDLSYNDITTEGAALVASALCSLLVHMEVLALDSNAIGAEGANLVFSALQCNSSIQKLALSGCDIHSSAEFSDVMRQS